MDKLKYFRCMNVKSAVKIKFNVIGSTTSMKWVARKEKNLQNTSTLYRTTIMTECLPNIFYYRITIIGLHSIAVKVDFLIKRDV